MSKFREDVRARLYELMDEADIPRPEFDATTLGELALKLERRRLRVFTTCSTCGARYTLGEWTYLDATGFWNLGNAEHHGDHDVAEYIRTPAGHTPEFEGRTCRCGAEMRIAVKHAKSSVPWYQNGQ